MALTPGEPLVVNASALREPRYYIITVENAYDEIVYNIAGARRWDFRRRQISPAVARLSKTADRKPAAGPRDVPYGHAAADVMGSLWAVRAVNG
jgi:hypothetical protein